MNKLILLKIFSILLLLSSVYANEEIEDSLNEKNINSIQNNLVTIGGYGELHYNEVWESSGEKTSSSFDFHRFVLFFGYTFNRYWVFKSEIELEHNLVGEDFAGELELEQASIHFTPFSELNFLGGVLLVSTGIYNENHEPPLFLSVERPLYQSRIIPTTWFGNGFGVYGNYRGFVYKLKIMEGLDADGISTSGIRGARGKGQRNEIRDENGNRANFKNPLVNFYLGYQGKNTHLGFSYIYNEAIASDRNDDELLINRNTKIHLLEYHFKYNNLGIYTTFEIGYIAYENQINGLEGSSGFYFDLGYNILDKLATKIELIPWVRYSWVNTSVNTSLGFNASSNQNIFRIGFALKPISQIILKIDYGQNITGSRSNNTITRELNAGFGYYF